MVNCNPETVSTDYDTSDRLYFEPLVEEDVLNVIEVERPMGVVVQFGGQTPLKLALPLARAGIPILGTSPDAIDRAEDRERFSKLITTLGLRQPRNGAARSGEEAYCHCFAHRLPGHRASIVCPGRAGDADRVRRTIATVNTSKTNGHDDCPIPTPDRPVFEPMPSRLTWMRFPTGPTSSWPASWNTWKKPAFILEIPPAPSLRTRWHVGVDRSDSHPDRGIGP